MLFPPSFVHDFVQLSFSFFVYFVQLVTEKVVLAPESLFRPGNGMGSTRLLFEIHNIGVLKCMLSTAKLDSNCLSSQT